MTGWALGLGIFGAITGTLGVASGFYSFILSGYRVKISLGFAILKNSGGHIEFNPSWTGDLAEHDDLSLQENALQILVQARNSGRSKIEVRQLVIQNYLKKATDETHLYFLIPGPPFEGTKMPHVLDFGSSCSWLIPLNNIRVLTTQEGQGKTLRYPIFAEIRLADGKSVLSKRSGLTPKQIDEIEAKWKRYRKERDNE